MNYLCLSLCYSSKGDSCNRHGIALKAYNAFYLDLCKKKKKSFLTVALKRQKSTGHSDGRTMRASPGRKAGGDGEEGSTEGMLRGRGGEAGVQRGTWW